MNNELDKELDCVTTFETKKVKNSDIKRAANSSPPANRCISCLCLLRLRAKGKGRKPVCSMVITLTLIQPRNLPSASHVFGGLICAVCMARPGFERESKAADFLVSEGVIASNDSEFVEVFPIEYEIIGYEE